MDTAETLQEILGLLRSLDERLGRLEETRPAEFYTTEQAGKILGKSAWTVRRWCELGQIRAEKTLSGRGRRSEWRIGHTELERIRKEGPKAY